MQGPFRRYIFQPVVFLVAAGLVTGARYYYYVEFEGDPYSEVGVGLNSIMPEKVRQWGCARLAERFPDKTPQGC